MDYLKIAGLVIGAYLVGSIPVGYLVARAARGVDIREHGSRNIGATNVGRVLGRSWGILVWFLDTLKGFVPALVGGILAGHAWGNYAVPAQSVLCGAAAICGHNFSVFLRFRGGKGVSTSLGVFIYLFPIGIAIALGVWVATVLTTRYVSLGSMLAGVALALSGLFIPPEPFGESLYLTSACILVAALIIVRHRSNIERLMRGAENKVRLGGQNRPGG